VEGPVVAGHGFALNDLLRATYFEVRSQECFQAGTKRLLRRSLDRLPGRMLFPRPRDRVFTVCEPFEGANELHEYRPPFGLAAYDERY